MQLLQLPIVHTTPLDSDEPQDPTPDFLWLMLQQVSGCQSWSLHKAREMEWLLVCVQRTCALNSSDSAELLTKACTVLLQAAQQVDFLLWSRGDRVFQLAHRLLPLAVKAQAKPALAILTAALLVLYRRCGGKLSNAIFQQADGLVLDYERAEEQWEGWRALAGTMMIVQL